MRGAIPPLPNTPSWRGAQEKSTGTAAAAAAVQGGNTLTNILMSCHLSHLQMLILFNFPFV
jgi:hypothetical protein